MAQKDNINAIMKGLEDVAERAVRKITLDVTANLIESTPVDTGWARANWVPSIGASVSVPAPNTGGGVGSAQAKQAAGIASVLGYTLGPVVYVSNNVPYITKLNEGSSKQAPQGFVQAAVVKAAKIDLAVTVGLR